jgi:hypothetical protein
MDLDRTERGSLDAQAQGALAPRAFLAKGRRATVAATMGFDPPRAICAP